MKLKLALSLSFLMVANLLSGQYLLPREGFFPGTITYSNGEVKRGYVAAPKKAKQGKVYFKPDKNSSVTYSTQGSAPM